MTTYEVLWSETVTYRTTITARNPEEAQQAFDYGEWDYEPKSIWTEIDGGPNFKPLED